MEARRGKSIKFSIIMPTYNRADRIQIAINSVLQQGYDDFELIIIDDCSTDNTFDVVYSNYKNEIEQNKIIYLKNEENRGERRR